MKKIVIALLAFFASHVLVSTPAYAIRDLETGTFLSRDPAGFVDGPNLYAYVMQNPWTCFDPNGLTKLFLVGGPRTKPERWEPDPAERHDTANDNYINSAVRHAAKERAALDKAGSKERMTMIVHGPSYEKRALAEKRNKGALLSHLQKAAKKHNFKLVIVSSAKEMMEAASAEANVEKASSLKFFGHSYANKMVPNFGEARDVSKMPKDEKIGYQEMNADTFGASDIATALPNEKVTPDFNCRLYGCNQGNPQGDNRGEGPSTAEELSKVYPGHEMMGSRGRVSYLPIGQGHMSPSSPGGYQYWKNGSIIRSDPANQRPAGE